MFGEYYIIKKWKFGAPFPICIGSFFQVAYIIGPIIMLIPIYIEYKIGLDKNFIRWSLFLIILMMVYGIHLLIESFKLKRVKDLKYNGGGMVKKARVISIEKTKFNKGKYEINIYYIKAEDEGITYYSNGTTKGVLLGTSMSELELLYAKYGFTFDKQEKQKDALLKKIDELIAEKGYEIENSSLISKIAKGKQLGNLKIDKKIVSDGYIPTYWQIDENKVTVGDFVDVYIDPSNPKRYRVDTDFLF